MNKRREVQSTLYMLPGARENIETHCEDNSKQAIQGKDCNEWLQCEEEAGSTIERDENLSAQLNVGSQRKHFDSVSSGHSTEFYVTGLTDFSEDQVTKYESAESFESLELDSPLVIPTIVIDFADSDSYDGSIGSNEEPESHPTTKSSSYDDIVTDAAGYEATVIPGRNEKTESVHRENNKITVSPLFDIGGNKNNDFVSVQIEADGDKKLWESKETLGRDFAESVIDEGEPSVVIDEETGEPQINPRKCEKDEKPRILDGHSLECEGPLNNSTRAEENSKLADGSRCFRVIISNNANSDVLKTNETEKKIQKKAAGNPEKHTMRRRREEGSGDHDESEDQLIDGELRDSYRIERQISDERHELEIRGDEWNIALLLALYLLQGIPLGLSTAIPMIIQNKGVSFKQQAEFSFTTWPFALKLVWAPLVDALFFPSFGRRKTWLVPAQYLIGFFMVFLSFNIETWLSSEGPQVSVLTWMFFAMNFLAATQDIAVDGWALTMLKRQNKSLASTCNSVGQSAGFFLGYVIFIALESPSFCNSYLRTEPSDVGIVTIPGFLYFWGLLYLLLTTLVALFKHEITGAQTERPSAKAALKSYRTLLRIFKLSNIRLFALLLLTVKIGFATFDGVTSLKFIANGVPKDKMAILAVPLVPLQIVLPIFITKMNNPRRPMDLFLKAYPYRLAFNLVGVLFVYITPLLLKDNEDIPYYFYISLIAILAVHQVLTSAMFVQLMAFFAMVSDVNSGGTYMTLLNTVSNLGAAWTTTTALATVDSVTFKSCAGSNLTLSNDCSDTMLKQECSSAGGSCDVIVDGYYVQQAILTIIGILWFCYGRKKIDYLQNRPLSTWAVPRR